MAVPKPLIRQRLNRNLDTLLITGSRLARQTFLAEINSPFSGSGKSGDASPFLKCLFPEIRLAATLERSLNTALGWGWDKIAGDIARATHGNAEVGYFVNGRLPAPTINMIDAMCIEYTSGAEHSSPNLDAELASLLPTVRTPGAKDDIREKDDVFYTTADGTEVHLEIKTPKPNYDQMRAAKRRILRIHCVRQPNRVRALVGFPYNPNGLFGEYGWPTTKYFVDFNADVLIGEAFWNFVGDSPNTYSELIECFVEVAISRKDDLLTLLESV